MIRTKLTYIEEHDVFAYRLKFSNGGIGVIVFNKNGYPSGTADINRKTGKAINHKKNDELLSDEVFTKACTATRFLPYHVLPPVTPTGSFIKNENIPDTVPCLKESIIARFDEFVSKFTESGGEFDRQQINKNFIQFALRSKVVSNMVNTEGCTVEAVMDFILKTKAAETARLILPFNGYTDALIDMLNDVCGCTAFQELEDVIKRKINKSQKKETN